MICCVRKNTVVVNFSLGMYIPSVGTEKPAVYDVADELFEHVGVRDLPSAGVVCAYRVLECWMAMRGFGEIPLRPTPVLDLFILYPEAFPLICGTNHSDGHLMGRRTGLTLEVNLEKSKVEQRFNIVHEFGHLALWELFSKISGSASSWSRSHQENFCDEFARHFLMPEPLVVRWINDFNSPLRSSEVQEGADFFKLLLVNLKTD